MPDETLRREYLKWVCEDAGMETVDDLASRTDGWTFAYLNELRITAAILAIQARRGAANEHDFAKAHDLLAAQHKSGKRLHVIPERRDDAGFAAA